MLSMCTPFDEESVGIIVDMGFDAIKVASCSARDWPLLSEVAASGKPVVLSTGGLSLGDITGQKSRKRSPFSVPADSEFGHAGYPDPKR